MNYCSELFRLLRRSVALALMLPLVGCETTPDFSFADFLREDARANWQEHSRWLESLTVWRTSGRLAVQVPDDGWSASLRWRQGAADYRIQLNGPFGQGAVRVDGTANEVVLRTADGRVRRAATPELLIAAELKAEVPVSLLRFWIIGRPAPAVAVQELVLDSGGRLQRLVQAGWLISYQEYEQFDAGALPTRLQIEHEQSQTEVRFVLDDWTTGG